MVDTAQSQPRRGGRLRRPELATQWQLMWWKYKRHHLALIGMSVLAMLVFLSVFAGFIGPEAPFSRNNKYISGGPMGIHFFDAEGNLHRRPFVYARTTKRDPVTLRKFSVLDESTHWPLRFFVRGAGYKFWGLIETDLHLFGAEGGFIHLFGTDTLGRDLFTRTLFATRVSLSVGAVGVTIAFILGAIIGGIAGFFGGMIDNLIMRLIEFIR